MELQTIAHIENGFHQKFGVPRQAKLLKEVQMSINFCGEFRDPSFYEDLEGMNFIWINFFMHLSSKKSSPKTRPPRLGGNTKISSLATRSPHRPNPIGQSLVRLINVDKKNHRLIIQGGDFVDGTPIFDIRPYHFEADLPWEDVKSGWMEQLRNDENALEVELAKSFKDCDPVVLQEIISILRLNPTPRYQSSDLKTYKFEYKNYHIEFKLDGPKATLCNISTLS